jgi:hypothetical protein
MRAGECYHCTQNEASISTATSIAPLTVLQFSSILLDVAGACCGYRSTDVRLSSGSPNNLTVMSIMYILNLILAMQRSHIILLLFLLFVAEQGVFMYWITNNCFSLVQSTALKNPRLREYLDFAKPPPPTPAPSTPLPPPAISPSE